MPFVGPPRACKLSSPRQSTDLILSICCLVISDKMSLSEHSQNGTCDSFSILDTGTAVVTTDVPLECSMHPTVDGPGPRNPNLKS